MRSTLFIALPSILLAGAIAFACGGSSNSSGFGDHNGSSSGGDDGSASGSGSGGDDGGNLFGNGDANNVGCQGLQCQWTPCSNMGKSETSLTGTVYDPAGALGLYNIYVYIPNAKPDPIQTGGPYQCTPCEAPASGQPIIGVSTDAQGHFNLTKGTNDMWGVPAGDNIPLVIQVGKWRKQLVIPHIDACTTLNLDQIFNQGTGTARKLRLPAKSSEGDMPLIAFTSGCDPAECFLRHIGIDDSEFVAPGAATPAPWPMVTAGAGHVHFYTAQDNNGSGDASKVAGGNTSAQTYQWWTNSANLSKYDIIFNACECNPNDRGATAYGAMHTFLNGGGRLFTTHYYYNWFTPPTGAADFQKVVAWAPESAMPFTNYYIDTSFPKGKAYGDWLVANSVANAVGSAVQIMLTDTRYDINASGPPTYADSSRWIYNADSPGSAQYSSAYVSFNTPVTTPTAQQCGRAVFSDVHLSGSSNDAQFPGECGPPGPGYDTNEKALEFLFFDLSSCVQDDTKPPPPPPAQ